MAETIKKYFNLSPRQSDQFDRAMELWREWNEKINVISRRDIDNIEVHHVLHSLAIAKFLRFAPGSRILDLGTGGGFPGIPLAILMPDVDFHLLDRIGKKIRVTREVAEGIGLTNVTFQHGDMGECKQKFDFAVSRAVMPQGDLLRLIRRNIASEQRNAMPNGLIALKGGELAGELSGIEERSLVEEISTRFDEDFFRTKKIVYTTAK